MSRPIVIICVEDIKKIVPHFTVDMVETHKSDCRALLHNLGMDTDYGIELQQGLETRTKLCGVCVSDRLVGCERTDKQWVLSKNSSHEARIFSEDATLRNEIRKMSKGVKKTNVNKENDLCSLAL